jgi:hypothetical protein
MKNALLAVLVLGIVSSLAGCLLIAGAGAATGGVLYIKGAAVKTYPTTVQKAYDAMFAVLKEDKVPVYKQEVGAEIGKLEGTLSDGTTIKIDFKATGTQTTEVTIRIGTFGDKDRSNYYFEKLDAKIK